MKVVGLCRDFRPCAARMTNDALWARGRVQVRQVTRGKRGMLLVPVRQVTQGKLGLLLIRD